MILEKIVTRRKIEPGASWDIAFEWENNLQSQFIPTPSFYHDNNVRFSEKLNHFLPFVKPFLMTRKTAFLFGMAVRLQDACCNRKNVLLTGSIIIWMQLLNLL